MEASLGNSPLNKPLFSDGEEPSPAMAAASAEESGWTIYFEDFFESEKGMETEGARYCMPNDIDGIGGSSMVSDAASCVAWRPRLAATAAEGRKKLSFKRRKARGSALDDDSLEDTASSPVNSPKISEANSMSLDPRRKDENRQISQEKDVEGCMREEMDGFDAAKSANDQCTELKKRGLCLVPLSILVDYLE